MAGRVADAGPLLLHVNLSAHNPLRGDLGEHPEQAAALAELGCHLAQGFHFSHPVPAAELAARLAGQQPVAGLRHPA
jgi:hypothetical protein